MVDRGQGCQLLRWDRVDKEVGRGEGGGENVTRSERTDVRMCRLIQRLRHTRTQDMKTDTQEHSIGTHIDTQSHRHQEVRAPNVCWFPKTKRKGGPLTT